MNKKILIIIGLLIIIGIISNIFIINTYPIKNNDNIQKNNYNIIPIRIVNTSLTTREGVLTITNENKTIQQKNIELGKNEVINTTLKIPKQYQNYKITIQEKTEENHLKIKENILYNNITKIIWSTIGSIIIVLLILTHLTKIDKITNKNNVKNKFKNLSKNNKIKVIVRKNFKHNGKKYYKGKKLKISKKFYQKAKKYLQKIN
ncbi:MAG: hypothetical protein ACOCP8_07370 [archaeon]